MIEEDRKYTFDDLRRDLANEAVGCYSSRWGSRLRRQKVGKPIYTLTEDGRIRIIGRTWYT